MQNKIEKWHKFTQLVSRISPDKCSCTHIDINYSMCMLININQKSRSYINNTKK